jgi:hypothetical protein
MHSVNLAINPLIALAVFASTAVTDAAYVFFNAAVGARRRIRAPNWSAVWDLGSGESCLCGIRRHWLLVRRLRLRDVAHPRRAEPRRSASRPAVSSLRRPL